jgi:hypothetical protein
VITGVFGDRSLGRMPGGELAWRGPGYDDGWVPARPGEVRAARDELTAVLGKETIMGEGAGRIEVSYTLTLPAGSVELHLSAGPETDRTAVAEVIGRVFAFGRDVLAGGVARDELVALAEELEGEAIEYRTGRHDEVSDALAAAAEDHAAEIRKLIGPGRPVVDRAPLAALAARLEKAAEEYTGTDDGPDSVAEQAGLYATELRGIIGGGGS